MYNIKLRNTRMGYLFGVPFLLVGLLFLVILSFLTFEGSIRKMSFDSKTKATRINENCDERGMCSPIYYFTVDNEEFECRVNYSSSALPNPKHSNVYYNSKEPNDCVTDYTVKPPIFMYLLLLFPLPFVYIGASISIRVRKKIINLKKLKTTGTLIKNLKYNLDAVGSNSRNGKIYAIVVDYELSSGSVLRLYSEPRYDGEISDADGLVDLLIDLNDTDNYYIDFNIERKN